MSLFAFLTKPRGSQKPVRQPAKTTRSAPGVKPGQAAGKARAATVTPIRPKQAPAQAPTQAPMVAVQGPTAAAVIPHYRSTSDLPAYKELVSLAGGPFALPVKAQDSMVVLLLADAESTYSIIATRETFGSAAYKGMLQRIESAGAKADRCGTADSALINKVNKEATDTALADESDKRIVRDIDKLAQAALDADASDIHIEKRYGSASVRMRVNGRLELYSDSWDGDYVDGMARALHTLADGDSKAQTYSENGQMSVSRTLQGGASVKLRVQTSQAYPDGGLDIVIRVLRVAAEAKVKQLTELGYAPEHIEMLQYMEAAPGGATIIAGVTGSGKTTTLQSLMTNVRMRDPGLKMISIEDPPEYVMPGVTQIPVPRRNNQKDNPFTQTMRSTMRMDPDVIMVGEVRDEESAQLSVAMVQSGHKVFGTIHAESALGVIARLQSMGVGSHVLGARSFISGLVYQTLVPVLCQHCKVDYDASDETLSPALHERIRQVTQPGDTIFLESPSGCEHCDGRGIVGRTVCAEMVIPDAAVRSCILQGDMAGAYDSWRSQRSQQAPESMAGATALDHGILKMRRGEVSPVAVESALGLLHDFTIERANPAAEASRLLAMGA